MVAPGGRYLPLLAVGGLTVLVTVLLFGRGGGGPGSPVRTQAVAALTAEPEDPSPEPVPASARPRSPSPDATVEPTTGPLPTVAGSGEPPSSPIPTAAGGLVAGSVDRTSLDLRVTYDVNAALTSTTGVLEVATTLVVRNIGATSIDRLELNTVAARLGRLRVTAATVDEQPVKVRVEDQTLFVPLGGVLPPGAGTTVLVAYRATLANGITGSDWMFSRYGGTFTLYRWIPWLSLALPFDRPNEGDPFLTVSSPEVSVEILTDLPLDLAAPAAEVAEFDAGAGRAWAFTLRDVRDVSLVLAEHFHVAEEEVGDVGVRAYARTSYLAAVRLLSVATEAVRLQRARLDVAFPWASLAVVETQGGEALESPGLVLIPEHLDTLNRTYMVHHEVAQQWFGGLVGNDQRNQPFADEAVADLLARTVLGSFRSTRCGREPLDRSIAGYSARCYYEVIYVQGGLLLEQVRARMGAGSFWAALRAYLEEHKGGLATTRDLLEALEAGSDVTLEPLLRGRFPSLY
jgi:hypothetical protein